MVVSCWVRGCTNRCDGSVKRGFFCIPAIRHHEGELTRTMSEDRRRAWLAIINRKDEPSQFSRICSDHFVTGKPAALYDRSHPDWVPSVKLSKSKPKTDASLKRYKKTAKSLKTKKKQNAAKALIGLFIGPEPTDSTDAQEDEDVEPTPICLFLKADNLEKLSEIPTTSSSVDLVNDTRVECETQRLVPENVTKQMKEQLTETDFSEEGLTGDDEKVKYFTGLPSFTILLAVFNFVKDFIPKPRCKSDLGQFTRLVITLMRLKLNIPLLDLALRFKTSPSTVSRTFVVVIHVLYIRLKHLLHWPEREELRKTMPVEFRMHFRKKVAVIIDCFEVFIQQPKNVLASAQTWSSCKHDNTVKFQLGITPQGSISFLSKAWGGRTSDTFLRERCGLMDKLLPGDLVFTYRDVDKTGSVGMCCSEVIIPNFTKGKVRLSPVDVETRIKIEHVRVHVERVMGLVRNKYSMLQSKLPVDFVISDEDIPTIDKMATVACALTNLCESVLPFH